MIRLLLVLISVLASLGCSDKDNLGAPKQFFAKNKIGGSADYAIMKGYFGDDHVVTVHGFMDDLSACLKLADKLNEEEPETYHCVPLNH